MIRVEATPDEMKAASQISKAASLQVVYLLSSRSRREVVLRKGDGPSKLDMRLDYEVRKHEIVEASTLRIELHSLVELLVLGSEEELEETDAEGKRPADVSIETVFAAEYRLPEGEMPESVREEGIPAFARLNGLINCWPYIRQEADHIAAQMRIPLLLPLLRVETRKPAAGKEGEQSPGDGEEEPSETK